MQSTLKNKTIFTRDNLDVLSGFNSNSVDLIYLDPPFNKNKQFTAPIGSSAEGASFDDIFRKEKIKDVWFHQIQQDYPGIHKLIDAAEAVGTKYDRYYLCYMAIRLLEIHRILKDTGSLYLHCDKTMSHYLKLLLDGIFGVDNFRGEIIWKRHNAHSDAVKKIAVLNDIIFYFTKSESFTYNSIRIPYSEKYLKDFYRYKDERGMFRLDNLTGAGVNENDEEWRGYHPAKRGRSWSIPKELVKNLVGEEQAKKMKSGEKLELLYKNGYIKISKNSVPSFKRYLDKNKGTLLGSIWTDVNPIGSQAKERVGYPTQKPIALLERIIKTSSSPGDLVLDPFCGCATACVAAEKLDRQWIGIDVSKKAYDLVKIRLGKEVQVGDAVSKENDYQTQRQLQYSGNVIHRTDCPARTDVDYLKLVGKQRIEVSKDLYRDQDGFCNGCLQHLERRHLEIDHKFPQKKGGGNNLDNLQLLCANCNRRKGTSSMQDFLSKQLQEGFITQTQLKQSR